MANNPFWVTETLQDSHGVNEPLSQGSQATPILAEARVILDDNFLAGVVDLSPYFAAVANPSLVIIDVPAGAAISFDGITYSLFDIQRLQMRFAGVGVPATIFLTLAAPSRVRAWLYGD